MLFKASVNISDLNSEVLIDFLKFICSESTQFMSNSIFSEIFIVGRKLLYLVLLTQSDYLIVLTALE